MSTELGKRKAEHVVDEELEDSRRKVQKWTGNSLGGLSRQLRWQAAQASTVPKRSASQLGDPQASGAGGKRARTSIPEKIRRAEYKPIPEEVFSDDEAETGASPGAVCLRRGCN